MQPRYINNWFSIQTSCLCLAVFLMIPYRNLTGFEISSKSELFQNVSYTEWQLVLTVVWPLMQCDTTWGARIQNQQGEFCTFSCQRLQFWEGNKFFYPIHTVPRARPQNKHSSFKDSITGYTPGCRQSCLHVAISSHFPLHTILDYIPTCVRDCHGKTIKSGMLRLCQI